MAGYGLKSFLIAQSLNQIEKAYGQNNSILDNCHVRVSFATNDERTAKRVSDALGTATEMRAMKNYAGSRLSPWLGHLMVSRQETARPLLTPGEVMQLPPDDELVLVSGCAPIRAKKARYFEDPEMQARILPPPALTNPKSPPTGERPSAPHGGDWAGAVVDASGIRHRRSRQRRNSARTRIAGTRRDRARAARSPFRSSSPRTRSRTTRFSASASCSAPSGPSPARSRSIPATTCRCDAHADQAHVSSSARPRRQAR